MSGKILAIALVAIILLAVSSCEQYDNFTTYFNTYYNAERIMKEAEDEFDYHDEKKRVTPRVQIPKPEFFIDEQKSLGPPQFMKEFVISQQKLQPVENKLDSIEIKGSKVLSYHPKSNYIEGMLFLMSKAYFYQNAWLNSQIKSSELIDRYPTGDFSPDAHLLMAKNYLIQRKFFEGNTLLSRTVDISWQKERYDILSEAFRLQAELALYENDIEGAYRPYLQAIAQSNDNDLKAKWQLELASLLFRIGKFDKSEKEFGKVMRYGPDYLTAFEAKLYRASSLARLGRFEEAEEIFEELENDGKYEEWQAHVFAERINMLRIENKDDELNEAEKFADSAYVAHQALMGAYFETGMKYFKEKDYTKARIYFARSKGAKSSVLETSQRLYYLINELDTKRQQVYPYMKMIDSGMVFDDSLSMKIASNLFEVGRVHEQLGNPDSARNYYQLSMTVSPVLNQSSARYYYAYSRSIKEINPFLSDSILDVIAQRYPLTDYGKEAMLSLGYTNEFVIDTVAELFESGDKLRKIQDYTNSVVQFTKLYEGYPEHKFAPKAIYTIGWLYEHDKPIPDSALYYYRMLIQKYPDSEYAADVRLCVAFLLAKRSGGELPDSLKTKVVVKEMAPKKGEAWAKATTPCQSERKG